MVGGVRYEDSSVTAINANGSDDSASDSGAAYVFVRGGSLTLPTWSFRDYLKPFNTGQNGQFGYPVAASGDTLVVGAFGEDSSATGVKGDGSDNSAFNSVAAYVFEQTGSEITGQQPLNTNLADGGSHDFIVIGTNNPSHTFTIKNVGTENLTRLTLTLDGLDAAMFTVTASAAARTHTADTNNRGKAAPAPHRSHPSPRPAPRSRASSGRRRVGNAGCHRRA